MNKRKLLKLADLLEKDAANPKGVKFDIRTWGSSNKEPNVSCGTAACAMGLAALSGAFRGLKAKPAYCFWEPDTNYITPWFDDHEGMDAASALFDIRYEEAEWLFDPTSYSASRQTGKRGELAVAKRIRDFAAGTAEPPRVD